MILEKTLLQEKIEKRKAKLCVVGLGYVGLPLAVEFVQAGFYVTGIDIDPIRIKQILRGRSYIPDLTDSELKGLIKKGKFKCISHFKNLQEQDIILICVPTPLNKSHSPDMSHILAVAKKIAEVVRKGQLIILESTCYPGTTRELLLPLFEKGGLKAGKDFFLSYSPERLDPGNSKYKIWNTPKIVAGITPPCTALGSRLYGQIVNRVIRVSSTNTAEMVKLLENTFRAVNIAFSNEICLMCDHLGVNVWEVIAAATTKPFGFMPFYPGPGVGGHCIPLDSQYLAWKMRSTQFEPRFLELASKINAFMPKFVGLKAARILRDHGQRIRKSHILVLGVTYKANVIDIRESPAIEVLKILRKMKADVVYHDPYIKTIILNGKKVISKKLTTNLLKESDLVLIATPHSIFDYKWIVKNSKLILNCRNATLGSKDSKIFYL